MNGYSLNHDKQIRKKRADYVLAVKGNQGTLLEDLKLYFGAFYKRVCFADLFAEA